MINNSSTKKPSLLENSQLLKVTYICVLGIKIYSQAFKNYFVLLQFYIQSEYSKLWIWIEYDITTYVYVLYFIQGGMLVMRKVTNL